MLGRTNVGGGGKAEGLYVWEKSQNESGYFTLNEMLTESPEILEQAYVTIYKNKVHFVYRYSHFTFDGKYWQVLSRTTPDFTKGKLIVYNNKLYVLGMNNGTSVYKTVYEYDDTNNLWNLRENMQLPSGVQPNSSVIVYNGKIHYLGGGAYSGTTGHFVYDGTSWSNGDALPVSDYYIQSIVFNDKLYCFFYSNSKKYAIWDEENGWSQVYSGIPIDILCAYGNCCAVLNNKIHISSMDHHYSFDGINWNEEPDIKNDAGQISRSFAIAELNGNLYSFGSSSGANRKKETILHYGFSAGYGNVNGYVVDDNPNKHYDEEIIGEDIYTSQFGKGKYLWRKNVATEAVHNHSIGALGTTSVYGSPMISWNDKIWIFGLNTTSQMEYYSYDVDSLTLKKEGDAPTTWLFKGDGVVINNICYLQENYNGYIYSFDGTSWTNIGSQNTNAALVEYNGELHVLGGSSNNTLHKKYVNGTWQTVDYIPIRFDTASAAVLDNKIQLIGGRSGGQYWYSWDGTSWTYIASSVIVQQHLKPNLLVKDGVMYAVGYKMADSNKAYEFSNSTAVEIESLLTTNSISACLHNNKIYYAGWSDNYLYELFDYFVKENETNIISANKFRYKDGEIIDGYIFKELNLKSSFKIFSIRSQQDRIGVVHDLGEVPKGFIICATNQVSGSVLTIKKNSASDVYVFANNSYMVDNSPIITDTTISISRYSSSYKWAAGDYMLYCWA